MPAMLESFHQRRDEVVAAVRSLSAIATGVGAKTLAARVEADLVKKLEADRFHLVVVGEFNHGKTTFVNALLGANVLPTGVTPTTAVIHHLEYAEAPRAELVHASGGRTTLPFEEVKRFSVGGEHAPHDATSDEVKHLEVGYPAGEILTRAHRPRRHARRERPVAPARGHHGRLHPPERPHGAVPPRRGPAAQGERARLLAGEASSGKASRDKILFVVTKRDIWDEAEQREALGYIEKELGKIVKHPKLFAVSAEKHLEGDVMSSGIGELLSHLTKFLAEERGRILLDNALGEGVEASKVLRRGIDARRRAAAMTVEELERRIGVLEKDLAGTSRTIEERRAGIREEVSAIKAWVRRDLEHFRDDVIKQLPAVIEQASIDELKGYLGRFLERTLTEWAQAETKEIGLALEALAEKTIALMREDANDTAKRLGDALGGDVRAPNVEVDTFKYDVGVVGLLTVGAGVLFTNPLIGGLLLVAAPVLAVVVRGRVEGRDEEARDRARAERHPRRGREDPAEARRDDRRVRRTPRRVGRHRRRGAPQGGHRGADHGEARALGAAADDGIRARLVRRGRCRARRGRRAHRRAAPLPPRARRCASACVPLPAAAPPPAP